jgi:hypothetical protein
MNNITDIEKIENLLKIGEYGKMFRVNYNGFRLYIQDEPFAYYSGLTGALSASTFKGDADSKRLDKWRNSMIDSFGQKNTENFVDMTADFGSLLHMSLVTIKEKGLIKWDEEKDRAYEYFVDAYIKKRLDPDYKTIKKIVYEYQKHVASLLQFIYERVQEIYAIETPAKNEALKIATPIDLFCLCKQTDTGEFNKTTINLKTSSQISQHQYEQVACELAMWNETYGDAEFTAIMRTKDWTESKTPTYEYKYLNKDESEILYKQAFERMKLCLNSQASYFPSPVTKMFKGETKAGQQPVIISKTLEQEWIETEK